MNRAFRVYRVTRYDTGVLLEYRQVRRRLAKSTFNQ